MGQYFSSNSSEKISAQMDYPYQINFKFKKKIVYNNLLFLYFEPNSEIVFDTTSDYSIINILLNNKTINLTIQLEELKKITNENGVYLEYTNFEKLDEGKIKIMLNFNKKIDHLVYYININRFNECYNK